MFPDSSRFVLVSLFNCISQLFDATSGLKLKYKSQLMFE